MGGSGFPILNAIIRCAPKPSRDMKDCVNESYDGEIKSTYCPVHDWYYDGKCENEDCRYRYSRERFLEDYYVLIKKTSKYVGNLNMGMDENYELNVPKRLEKKALEFRLIHTHRGGNMKEFVRKFKALDYDFSSLEDKNPYNIFFEIEFTRESLKEWEKNNERKSTKTKK